MLGGMSGGGMGFIFDPKRKPEAQQRLGDLMREVSGKLAGGVAFAMKPVVYDFSINERGTFAELKLGADAILPDDYYTLCCQRCCARISGFCRNASEATWSGSAHSLMTRRRARACAGFLDRLLPHGNRDEEQAETLDSVLARNGFDPVQHERIQAELRAGHIGVAQNRLPASVQIEDVAAEQLFDARREVDTKFTKMGKKRLRPAQSRW